MSNKKSKKNVCSSNVFLEDALNNSFVVSKNLPDLPAIIHYEDEMGARHIIKNLNSLDKIEVSSGILSFENIPKKQRKIYKHCFYYYIKNLSFLTAVAYHSNVVSSCFVKSGELGALVCLSPAQAKTFWVQKISPTFKSYVYGDRMRGFLRFCCRTSLGNWNPSLINLVSKLPVPKYEKYNSVLNQKAFIPISDQKLIVRFIDEIAQKLSYKHEVPFKTLRITSLLILHYSQGLRPFQSALIEHEDVTITSYEHLRVRFPWVKQRSKNKGRWALRRIKNDWAPVFTEFVKALKAIELSTISYPDKLFGCKPHKISLELQDITKKLTNTPYSANKFRHTAIQRLADAGYSLEELAEFATHTDIRTCLIYITNAASEAEIVNKALGLSTVYNTIEKISRTGFIDKNELLGLPDDQKIGAVVYAIPISGIGACLKGQPLCNLNPCISCYSCPKFLPINDIGVHKETASALRRVVKMFYSASKGEMGNPAFTQLRATIESILSLIKSLSTQSSKS